MPRCSFKTASKISDCGRNFYSARAALSGIGPGTAVHGLTDGSWGSVDAFLVLAELAGGGDLAISTWTAATTDLKAVEVLLTRLKSSFGSVRFCLDVSFPKLRPRECDYLRTVFGDDSIRLANSHAKFAVLTGGAMEFVYFTSGNFNANPRLENFVCHCDSEADVAAGTGLAMNYRVWIDEAFAHQAPKSAFRDPSLGRELSGFIMKRRVGESAGRRSKSNANPFAAELEL